MKGNVKLLLLLVVLLVLGYLAYEGILPFALGTAYGLFVVNFIEYLAVFFASMMVSYFGRKVFGPIIKEKVSSLLKKY